MIRSVLVATTAMVMLCARAEAAVYTISQDLQYSGSDTDTFIRTVFVPLFDTSRGSLNGLTFTVNGIATNTVSYYQNTPPASGTFQNFIQFNRDAPIILSTTSYNRGSFTSPTSFGETFGVNASASYPASYIQPSDRSVALSLIVEGIAQPTDCCAYTFTRLQGTLATTYDYTPFAATVPEPVSLALLAVPVLFAGAIRRRT